MSQENQTGKNTDLLGIAPLARVVERVADSGLSAVEAVLSRVCLPALEEVGLLLKPRRSGYRSNRADTLKEPQGGQS